MPSKKHIIMNTKICFKCKIEKELDCFHKRHTRKNAFSSYCKECDSIRRRKWDKDHPDKYLLQRKNANLSHKVKYENLRKCINGIKQAKGCSVCGYKDFAECLQFHHVDSYAKKNCVSEMIAAIRPLSEIMEEISQCDILCSNCHSILHYSEHKHKQGKYRPSDLVRKARKCDKIDRQKTEYGCLCCGYKDSPKALVFHHAKSSEKGMGISKMKSFSEENVSSEIKKCVILCQNCHFLIHRGLITLPLDGVYQIPLRST